MNTSCPQKVWYPLPTHKPLSGQSTTVNSCGLEAKLSRCVSKQDTRQLHLSPPCPADWHGRHEAVGLAPRQGRAACRYVQRLPLAAVPCFQYILEDTKLDRASEMPTTHVRGVSVQDFNSLHFIFEILLLWGRRTFSSKFILSYWIKKATTDQDP